MKPTDEQLEAIDLARIGRHMAIEAFAGAGKTSTLKLVGDALGDKLGQYVAFNKSIAMDAATKFPDHVACNTAHSLAMRAVGIKYRHRLGQKRMYNREIADFLGIDPIDVPLDGGGRKRLSKARLAGIVMRGVQGFAITADKAPTYRHIPYIDGIDIPVAGRRTYANNDLVRFELEQALQKAWKDMLDTDGTLPYTHNYYLKLWELTGPRIEADFILHDESQDCNGAMLSIVQQQRDWAQLIWVGDRYQQIMGWNGAVNAMEKVEVDDRTWLTQSFRFGTEIAAVANLALADLEALKFVHGVGPDGRVGHIDVPVAMLFRTNAGVVDTALRYIELGRKVFIVGGAEEIIRFARAAQELQTVGNTDHPELWAFGSWTEVREYVTSEDNEADDLKRLVKLIDEHGAEKIIATMGATVTEGNADTILSTAHKSKGREWDTVKLGGDFPTEQKAPLEDEEIRLLYVAATRAKTALDPTLCPYFTKG